MKIIIGGSPEVQPHKPANMAVDSSSYEILESFTLSGLLKLNNLIWELPFWSVHTHKQLLTKVHEKALLNFKGSQAKKDWGPVI